MSDERLLAPALDDYAQNVNAWLDATKKQVAALAKLQKATQVGNVRDMEKSRQSASNFAEIAAERAAQCGLFEFDIAAYLRDGFLDELQNTAQKAGVRLYERDGVIFCYPALVRLEPDLAAVRIDKRLEPNIRPETLVARLKREQNTDPKAKPERFIETLASAYEFLRAKRGVSHIDLPLSEIYALLTLLPGSDKDYTLLDFTRDLYFLDISDVIETRSGLRLSLPASTVSREKSAKILPFVTRDGHKKAYASVRFTPAS